MRITGIDHLVLTVADPERTAEFYHRVLGMEIGRDPRGRLSLHFGRQRINLHPAGAEYSPHARLPCPGSADLCLLTDTPPEDLIRELAEHGTAVIEGPVRRQGGIGPMLSVYFHDPDGNLIEISSPLSREPSTSG